MKEFTVQLTLTIKAKKVSDAYGIGVGAAEHLLDTFNDDDSISPLVRVEAEIKQDH